MQPGRLRARPLALPSPRPPRAGGSLASRAAVQVLSCAQVHESQPAKATWRVSQLRGGSRADVWRDRGVQHGGRVEPKLAHAAHACARSHSSSSAHSTTHRVSSWKAKAVSQPARPAPSMQHSAACSASRAAGRGGRPGWRRGAPGRGVNVRLRAIVCAAWRPIACERRHSCRPGPCCSALSASHHCCPGPCASTPKVVATPTTICEDNGR